MSDDDVTLPGGGNHGVNSLSVVVGTAVIVVVVIGLSVQTTQVSRPNFIVERHSLRVPLNISESNFKRCEVNGSVASTGWAIKLDHV